MKIYAPLFIFYRIVGYSLLFYGVAEIIRLDALFPMEDGYYGEISFTEFSQELILLILSIMYWRAGRRFTEIQPVANILSIGFLASFVREFNFLIGWWFYIVLPLLLMMVYVVIRNYSKLKQASVAFFSSPASTWFFSGFLITYLYSRLMGRSTFWLLLYEPENYRLAKAAVEEGLELGGNFLMLISVFELFIYFKQLRKKEQK